MSEKFQSVSYISRSARSWRRGAPVSRVCPGEGCLSAGTRGRVVRLVTAGRGVRKVSKSCSYPQVSEKYFPKYFQSVSYISRSTAGRRRVTPVSRVPRGGVLKSGPSGTHGAPGGGRGFPGRGRWSPGVPPAGPGRGTALGAVGELVEAVAAAGSSESLPPGRWALGRGVSRRPRGPWRSAGGPPGRAAANGGRLVRGGPPAGGVERSSRAPSL